MLTPSQLAVDLHRLGIREGDSVLTHASYKAIAGQEGVEDGPAGVVEALIQAVGPSGCALFPAHTWLGASTKRPPRVEMATTEPRAVGAIPIAAFHHPNQVRSQHPTHSVTAIGPRASWFTERHLDEATGICGIDSPYERLARPSTGSNVGRGWILLLGVDHERNTSLHMIEELLEVPRSMTKPVVVTMSLSDGSTVKRRSRFHQNHPRRFQVLDPVFDAEGIQVRGKVGYAEARLVDASAQMIRALDLVGRDRTLLFTRSATNRKGIHLPSD